MTTDLNNEYALPAPLSHLTARPDIAVWNLSLHRIYFDNNSGPSEADKKWRGLACAKGRGQVTRVNLSVLTDSYGLYM